MESEAKVRVSREVQQKIEEAIATGYAVEHSAPVERAEHGRLCHIVRVSLPWPPSVNHCYQPFGNKIVFSKIGRQYPKNVLAACLDQRAGRVIGKLTIRIWAYPPDLRTRDCDNLLKSPLDALCKAGIFDNDGQVRRIEIERCGVVKDGRLEVEIEGDEP